MTKKKNSSKELKEFPSISKAELLEIERRWIIDDSLLAMVEIHLRYTHKSGKAKDKENMIMSSQSRKDIMRYMPLFIETVGGRSLITLSFPGEGDPYSEAQILFSEAYWCKARIKSRDSSYRFTTIRRIFTLLYEMATKGPFASMIPALRWRPPRGEGEITIWYENYLKRDSYSMQEWADDYKKLANKQL